MFLVLKILSGKIFAAENVAGSKDRTGSNSKSPFGNLCFTDEEHKVCWPPPYLVVCSTIPLFIHKYTWFTAGIVGVIPTTLCLTPSFKHLCHLHLKVSENPDWVDWINGNFETTSFSVIALLFGIQDAYSPVPVQTCLTCVNVFQNQTLSAKFCFSLIDISSMVQYFKALAKYKLCF